MTPIYRQILKKSWQITWRHKYLWFFGIFVALLGSTGEYQILIQAANREPLEASFYQAVNRFSEAGVFTLSALANLGKLFLVDPFGVFLNLFIWVVILVIIVFIIWLVVVSQAALFDSAVKISQGRSTSIQKEVKIGIRNFLPVFGLNVVAKAIIFIVLVIVGLPLFYLITQSSSAWNILLNFIFFLLFIPLAIIISFIIKYAMCFVVLAKKNFLDAFTEGWRLFIKHWIISLEMALILFVVSFLVGVATILAVLLALLPFFVLGFVFFLLASPWGLGLVVVFGLLVSLGVLIIFSAPLAVFQYSSWALLFMRLTKEGGVSKIVRIASSLPEYFIGARGKK